MWQWQGWKKFVRKQVAFSKWCLRHCGASPQIPAMIEPSQKKKKEKENVLHISAQFAKLFLLVVMDFL